MIGVFPHWMSPGGQIAIGLYNYVTASSDWQREKPSGTLAARLLAKKKQEGFLVVDEWFYTWHPEIFRFMPKKAELQKTLF